MKNIIRTHLIPCVCTLLFILAAGCQNNGNIGNMYGMWKVTHIECENTSLPDYSGNMFWSFQHCTVCVTLTGDYNVFQGYGNWRIEDNTFFISFPDKKYRPPYYTGIPEEGSMQILKSTGSEFIVSYHPDLDSSITYYLKKW